MAPLIYIGDAHAKQKFVASIRRSIIIIGTDHVRQHCSKSLSRKSQEPINRISRIAFRNNEADDKPLLRQHQLWLIATTGVHETLLYF